MLSYPAELARRLIALGLCSERDFRRSRKMVKRLSRDLPPFESVWVDALVQKRSITPYQAEQIAAGQEALLRVGPYLLRDRKWSDHRITLFQARHINGQESCDIAFLESFTADREDLVRRLRELANQQRDALSRHVLPLRTANLSQERLVVVSEAANGRTLQELLIRRGRFPAMVVVEIARQLIQGLSDLERVGLIHGDLRSRLIVLDRHGRCALTWPGVLMTVSPHLSYHTHLPPDCYDGIAPELIDTRCERGTASEMFALGCLLWELTTGRPPFPGGDALTKLSTAQCQNVPDVRALAPECPAMFAKLLSLLTSRNPADRPESFALLHRQLGPPRKAGLARLTRFARQFESAAPRADDTFCSRRLPFHKIGIGLTAALALCAIGLSQAGSRSELLHITHALHRRIFQQTDDTETSKAQPLRQEPSKSSGVRQSVEAVTRQKLLTKNHGFPLPELSDDGVLTLPHDGPFRAASLSTSGPLTIRGASGTLPVILSQDHPLRLSASTVILENVVLRRAASETAAAGPLLSVTAKDFGLKHCWIDDTPSVRREKPPGLTTPPAIFWQSSVNQGNVTGRIVVQNTICMTHGSFIRCSAAPRVVQCHHLLATGPGDLFDFHAVKNAARPIDMLFHHVTCRATGAVVVLPEAPNVSIQLSVERSLFSPRDGYGLIAVSEASSVSAADELSNAIVITGEESLLQENAMLLVRRRQNGTVVPLDDSLLSIEGIQYAQLRFAGSDLRNPGMSILSIPLPEQVGFDPGVFTLPVRQAYNSPLSSKRTSPRD